MHVDIDLKYTTTQNISSGTGNILKSFGHQGYWIGLHNGTFRLLPPSSICSLVAFRYSTHQLLGCLVGVCNLLPGNGSMFTALYCPGSPNIDLAIVK